MDPGLDYVKSYTYDVPYNRWAKNKYTQIPGLERSSLFGWTEST